jgi:pimeloyl-ACP methyl ester carboxylesterase
LDAHRYAYLHGFASSPRALKGVALRTRLERRGIDLELPDLNLPSFGELSMQAMLDRLDALYDERPGATFRLIGSSLGGWLAARWAELHPERVDRLVLLCPAFDIHRRWPTILPPGSIERWRARGSLLLPDADGRLVALHLAFYDETARQPGTPRVSRPTTVIHGTRDDRVPIESSRRWVPEQPDATLIEVDDGHDLHASIDVIEREVRARFAL